jgi:dihydrodipicolinate synthase/N-acetylneuraminate lyase
MKKQLKGLFALLPLALDEQLRPAVSALRHNIELVAKSGTPGFILFGSVGQSFTVSESEFDALCRESTRLAKEFDLVSIVGGTAHNQQEAIRRARVAEDAGADGTMLAVPYALPLDDRMIADFFREVDKSLSGHLQIMVYNYIPLARVNISASTWRQDLLDIPSISAVKESNFALPHFDEVLTSISHKINVFTGNEPAFFHGSMLGAKGITGWFSWAGLKTANRFVQQCSAGNHDDPWVRRVFQAFQFASAAIRVPEMPPLYTHEFAYLKAMVELSGGKAGPLRGPFRELPADALATVDRALEPIREIERELT